jgi:hypothetical protein
MTRTLRRHYNDKATVLIRERLAVLTADKPERTIAAEAGFKSTNMLSMIKGGRSKVPLERVDGIARALGVDPMLLFRLALEQHFEEGSEEMSIAETICITANEMEIIDRIRAASNGSDPEMTSRKEQAVTAAFS